MNPGSPTADGERGALQNRPARREEAGAVKRERGGRRGSRQPPAVTGPVTAFPWPASGRCECGRTRGAEDGVLARGLVHRNPRGGDFGVQSRAGPRLRQWADRSPTRRPLPLQESRGGWCPEGPEGREWGDGLAGRESDLARWVASRTSCGRETPDSQGTRGLLRYPLAPLTARGRDSPPGCLDSSGFPLAGRARWTVTDREGGGL